MCRKKTQPKKNVTPDPKFKSTIIPKLINNIMYDGKRDVAAKIVYDAIDKIKTSIILKIKIKGCFFIDNTKCISGMQKKT